MAAQSAAEALGRRPEGDKNWFRVLPKPANFDAKTREEELSQWRDFSWSVEQYLSSMDGAFAEDFKELRKRPDTVVDPSIQTDQERQRSTFLYSLLASLVRQRPLALVRQVKDSNGMEAYRMLIKSLEPASENRSLGLLTMILEWKPFDVKKGSILGQLLRLEEAYAEYEKTGAKLEDTIKFAVLMKCVSGQLKTWLQLNVAKSQDYGQLREAVIQYDTATLRWSSTMMLGGESSEGPTPMEIDRIKGKGDGKSKGKGKDYERKGKGKGDQPKGGKAKGKTYGKGYDGGGKAQSKGSKGDQQKGKGKSEQPVKTCFTCGKAGHLARDCWRVRQVSDESGQSKINAETATQASTGATSQATTWKSGTIKRISMVPTVSRISHEFDEESVVFDLRQSGTGGTSSAVRVVQFYNIAGEEELTSDSGEQLVLNVNMVKSMVNEFEMEDGDELVNIIIDSGADATILPSGYLGVGIEADEDEPKLQDAQGTSIATKGYRHVCFHFEDENGKHIQIYDKAHFSDGISQPILSFGKLLEGGWSIDGGQCAMTYGVEGSKLRIPLKLQNKSLTAEGYVRAIACGPHVVRMLEAKLNDDMEQKVKQQVGWKQMDNRWIGVRVGKKMQNPQYVGGIPGDVDWLRTTLARVDGKWQLLEMCESLHGLQDQEEPLENAAENTLILTILTKEAMATEDMGFEVDSELKALPDEGVPRREHELPVEEGLPVEDGPVADEPGPRVEEVIQEGRLELAAGLPDHIVVNEVELTAVSRLRELRAACFFGVSQSGSRLKCYQRLVSYLKEREIKAAAEAVAAAEMQVARRPKMQPVIPVPSQEAQDLHALSHVPYQPWCEACLKHRGRPDRHMRTGASRIGGVPVISLDFAYAKAGEVEREPQRVDRGQEIEEDMVVDLYEAEQDEGQEAVRIREVKSTVWLVMTCSQTGTLGAVPLQSKGQLNLMAREVMTFVQNLGHVEIGLYGDNEPTIRTLLRIILNSRHAMGLRTRLYTTKVRDSAGNSLAENAIQRIRGLACTLMEQVKSQTGLPYNTNHALWSWAARHACWLLNRYQASRGTTSYELIHGKAYDGLLVPFACPVYAFVRPQSGKGNPRWRMSLFLGKTEGQDSWIVGDGSQVMLTRSVRRVARPWRSFLAYYQNFTTASFEYQVNFGGRIVPSKRAASAIPLQMTKALPKEEVFFRYRDTEAEEVERYALSKEGREESRNEIEEVTQERLAAGETLNALEGEPAPQAPQHEVPSGGMQTPPVPAEQTGARGSGGEEDVPMVIPPLPWEEKEPTPEGRALRKLPPPASAVKAEPEAKRARHGEGAGVSSSSKTHQLNVERRVEKVCLEEETMYHLDEVVDVEALAIEDGEDEVEDLSPGAIPEELWSDEPPFRTPPEPLPEVDMLANKVEEQRLMRMGVLESLKREDFWLDRLTTRFVHDWRVKLYVPSEGPPRKRWLRRSRMVAREYANDKRDDVFSPASGHNVLRVLPALFLNSVVNNVVMEGEHGPPVIGALDIKDAFLQVEQERPLQISTALGRYKVLKNLPGQRIGAKAWYEHLRGYLADELNFEFDVINPCLGKQGDGQSLVCILIHVDDVMFTGRQKAVEDFVTKLKEKFEVDVTMVKEYGQEFSFLKRKYIYVEDGLLIKPGQYAANIIKTYEDHFGPARKQKLPATSDIQDADGSNLASPEDAAIFRSIVGMGIYLAQERMDVAFVVKELASRMSSPTEISLLKVQKFVGYLKETESQHILLPLPQRGQGMHMRSHELWILESYTDADWSGNRATRKSTSSSVHALNGMIIYSTSRGQKVVSLSSAESELHALVAGACDGICFKHVIEFLTGEQVQHVCWVDNSATRQIACKRGAGRLRHISGKLLWCQDRVANGSLEVKQIGTAYNLADIGTKPLSKVRLRLLLFWCHARDGDGERVGEKEHQQFQEQHVEKGKIMKVAKYLNRLMMVSGLELAAGETTDMVMIQPNYKIPFYMLIFIIVIGALVFGAMLLWNKFQKLERRVDMLQAYVTQLEAEKEKKSREESMAQDFMERIYRGLVFAGGHVEASSVASAEWDYLQYLEAVNRRHEGLRLRQRWKDQERIRGERGGNLERSRLPHLTADQRAMVEGRGPTTTGAAPREGEEDLSGENLSGDTVSIRLDNGEVVTIPVEYVETTTAGPDVGSSRDAPMNPEPEPVPAAEGEESDESMAESSDQGGPPMIHTGDWEPDRVEIPAAQFQVYNKAVTRADPVTREELLKIEALWYHAVRVKDPELENHMYRAMEDAFPYMDPANPLN